MLKISPEILSLQPYRPGKPIAEAKRELGLSELFKLASNESPWGPSPAAISALRNAEGELHLYPDASGHDLHHAWAEYLQVPATHLTSGNGSNELIDLLIRLFCEPGEAILTPAKSFIAYRICAQAARVKTIESTIDANFNIDLKDIEKHLMADPKIRLVFLANPNNPTGTYLSADKIRRFLKNAAQANTLVVVDEAYHEYVRAPDYKSMVSFLSEFPNLIVLRTMSKVFGLAALRLGVMAARPEIIELVNRIRNPFNVNSLAQVAGVAALRDQAHTTKVVASTHAGLDRMAELFKQMSLAYVPSQGNFLLVNCQRDGEKLFQSLLRRGVIVRPVGNYGLDQYLRISVGLEKEIVALHRALELSLKDVPPLKGAY